MFDIFNIVPLLSLFLLTTYAVYPVLLGGGIQLVLKDYLSALSITFGVIGSLLVFLGGSFRSGFQEFIFRFGKFLISIPKYFFRASENIKISKAKKEMYLPKKKNNFSILNTLKMKFTNTLRNEESQSAKRDDHSYIDRYEEEIVEAKDVLIDEAAHEKTDAQEIEEARVVSGEAKVEKKKVYRQRKAKVNEEQYYDLVSLMAKRKSGNVNKDPDDKYFRQIVERIEEKLAEFKIDGEIINILKGPVVDTFELELGSGVKVSKVTSAAEDLSLALYGAPIRIVYPMKGRTTVGIEVPRNPRDIIYLDEVLSSKEFTKNKDRLPVCMGKDAFGETFVVDLAGMPHMLVAGATGAGKSVFINTLLVSLLVKKSPSQMKLILIDPKQLELALYAKLPHLIMPVITDAKTASISLLWAVQEMDRRYSILKDLGVRNIEGFNQKLKRSTPEELASINHYYDDGDDNGYELPYLVIIVDEFADLILTKAGKEIENNICRLAAKARAAGIHLVLATQRPSVDVITGLIKSNFPTRVSFRVTTSVDSRTILNAVGAEKLLGKGDMLYKHGVETSRVHSAYVDETEIEALADNLTNFECSFHNGAMEFLENGGEVEQDPYAFGSHITPTRDNDSSKDELYDEAVRVVMEHRSASASMLQRRMKVGYNRAANLIEEMERNGIVGPAQGSKPRKILVSQ